MSENKNKDAEQTKHADQTAENVQKAPEDQTADTAAGAVPVAAPAAPAKGSAEWYEEKVPVRLFKDGGKYQDDVFVAVNGKGYLIQRGKEVMVPRYVAQVLDQSMTQDQRAAELMDKEAAGFAAASAARGL